MWQWLICNRELVNMGLQFLIAIAGCLIVVGLWYHRKAVLLQRDSLQAAMFSEASGRLSTILGEIPAKPVKNEKSTKMYNWHIRLFNELESLVFLEKYKYLSPEMTEYYKHFIVEYIDDLQKDFPEVAKEFATLPETTFSHMRKYYKDITGKNIPF